MNFTPNCSKCWLVLKPLGVPPEKKSEFARNMARYIKESEKLGWVEAHHGNREALLINLVGSMPKFTIDDKEAALGALKSASEKQLQKGIYGLRPVLPVARRTTLLVSTSFFPVPGIIMIPLQLLLEAASFTLERFNSHVAKKAAQLQNAACLVENIRSRYPKIPLS